jgi:hypothetical protein
MRSCRLLIAALLVALIAACAGGMTGDECAAADWAAIGYDDGAAGADAERFDERAAACAARGVAVNSAAYEQGRDRGLAAYCSPEGGFAAGRSGEKYLGVCPPQSEPIFLERYALGARLAELTRAHERSKGDYEAAVAELDQNRYLLRVAESRYAKSSISNEDREHERQDIDYRRREIARLEGAVPKLLSAIEETRAALDTFKSALLELSK